MHANPPGDIHIYFNTKNCLRLALSVASHSQKYCKCSSLNSSVYVSDVDMFPPWIEY